MSFKPPVSGLIKYLSKMKGIASDKIAGNREQYCLLDREKLSVFYSQERQRSCYSALEGCQMLPQKRWLSFFFSTGLVIRREVFFLLKAMVTLVNKVSILEPLWSSMIILGLDICFRLEHNQHSQSL